MSSLNDVLRSYSSHVAVPWSENCAPAQRVIFCVYSETDELKLRLKLDEFEMSTREAKHGWHVFDLTSTFPTWIKNQRYVEKYYQKPKNLSLLMSKYRTFLKDSFESFLIETEATSNDVVVLKGVGTLFGLLKVKEVVEGLAPMVKGRLVVFFPGSYENDNYRLLDGYDGWNYLAIPITGKI
jgi:hypothetical protein